MRRRLCTTIGLAAIAAAVIMPTANEAKASSHREAPFITKNPKVDGTDFYMFQSYGDGNLDGNGNSLFTTIIANYIPLEDSYGGPNYFTFDPDALYEIEIENSGDAVEDITFQFQFKNSLNGGGKGIALNVGGKMNSIPTVQANVNRAAPGTDVPIDVTNEANFLNVQETYTINMVKGPRRTGTPSAVANATAGGTTFKKPVDYIGSSTLGNAAAYAAYANAHVQNITIPGCGTPGRVFVGQRAEGFRVNLGLIFDLVNVTNLGGLATIIDPAARGALNFDPSQTFGASNYGFDNTATKNVTSIAMEVPTKCLTSDGKDPLLTARPKIGGWTTASVRQARIINPQATYDKPTKEGGAWAQVSRLGMPLTNEVVIGIGDKDHFNSSEPKDDAQFADYVTNPTLPQILQAIFGGANMKFPAGTVVRSDLVAIFLTGIAGVNNTGSTAEMLRLNTALPTLPSGSQTDLGAALCFPYTTCGPAANIAACLAPTTTTNVVGGCDTGGFPNGRRPGDDVVDIELTSLLGYFVPSAQAPAGGNVLHDAVLNTETQFDPNFPYLKAPHSGDQ